MSTGGGDGITKVDRRQGREKEKGTEKLTIARGARQERAAVLENFTLQKRNQERQTEENSPVGIKASPRKGGPAVQNVFLS